MHWTVKVEVVKGGGTMRYSSPGQTAAPVLVAAAAEWHKADT